MTERSHLWIVWIATVLLAQAALAQSPPGELSQPEPAAAPAAAAAAPAPPVSAFQILLNEAKRLSSQGKYYDAALLFHKILAEGNEADPAFQEAQYEMGVALFQLGLYVSAFGYFDQVADRGPDHLRFRHTLPWLVRIHRVIPGERSSMLRMSSYPVEAYPADLADEISFYVGQFYFYEGNLAKAREALDRVTPNSPSIYARAMYLKGAVHVRLNEAGPASEAFKEVLRFVQAHGRDVVDSKRLEEMTIMALARIFYSTTQYDTAVRYYDLVSDDSDQWLDSLFEKSWAYFQVQQYARALGNLHTVASPYFEEEFYPEAHVLKAVIFFKNCYYDEALETIDPFYKEYYDVLKELEGTIKGQTDPTRFYQYLAAISVKGGQYSLKVKKIFNAALADRRVRSLFEFVVHINREMAQLEELRKHPVARSLVDLLLPDLTAYRALTMAEAGQLAHERLQRVHKELKGLLSQALRVRFEALNAQKGILGEAARREQVVSTSGTGGVPVDVEHVLWPFDGEYWKDELGSYYYPLESRCQAK